MEMNQTQKRLMLLAEARRRQQQAQGGQPAPQEQTGFFSSIGNAFRANVDPILEGIGTTAEVLGAEGLGRELKEATSLPEGYVSPTERFANADKEQDGSFAWRFLPGMIGEQVGQFAGSLAARAAGAAGGGALGSMAGPGGTAVGAAVGGFAGPAAFEAMQVLGPIAQERARNDGREQVTADDLKAAAMTAAASGALNALAPGAQGFVKRMFLEGATEYGQELTQQAGETAGTERGLDLDTREATVAAIAGAGSAATVDTTIAAARKVGDAAVPQAVKDMVSRTDGREFSDDEKRAAERLVRAADGNMDVLGNTNDIGEGTAKGAANAALREARAEAEVIVNRLRAYARAQKNDETLAAVNTLAKQISDQGTPTPQSHIDKLVEQIGPETADARRLSSLAREINAIQNFTKNGTRDMGGFSQFTRKLDLLDKRNDLGLMATGFAVMASPLAVAGVGINRTARVIDKLTNNRSRVKRFVDSALKDGKRPLPIQGPTASDALTDLQNRRKAEAAAEKLKLDTAIQRAQRGEAIDPALRGSMDAKTLARIEKLEQEAANRKMEEEATADLFMPGVQVPKPEGVDASPIVQGHYVWQQATGLTPLETFRTLQDLEAEGKVPRGTASRYRTNIRSFDGADETPSIQRMVANRRGSKGQGNFRPKPTVDPQVALDKFKARLENAKDRRSFKQLQGQRASAAVFEAIQQATPTLDAKTRENLLKLWQGMDTPAMTRDARFELMNQTLPEILGANKHRALLKRMTPLFQDLAAAGNDYEITREEAEAKREKEFNETRKNPKPRKAKKKAEARTPEEAADRALSKLKKKRQAPKPIQPTTVEEVRMAEEPQLPNYYYEVMGKDAPTPDGLKDVTPREEDPRRLRGPEDPRRLTGPEDRLALPAPQQEAEATPPTQPKSAAQRRREGSGSGRGTNLVERVDEAVDRIGYALQLAEDEGAVLDEFKRSLPKNSAGRVAGIILDLASDRVTVNMVVDEFASRFGIEPRFAAAEVSKALTEMSNANILEVTGAFGDASILKYDGKLARGADGEPLFVRQINLYKEGTKRSNLDQNFAHMVEVAKAVRKSERHVPQDQDPEYDYSPNRLTWKGHNALKNIAPGRVDRSFTPLLDFVNAMRNQRLAMNLDIMRQINDALPGVGGQKLGPIGKLLRPGGNEDEGPMRTFAYLLHMMQENGGGNLFRQEFMAGANGRVYSINGDASTQGGDLMKAIPRAPEKSKLGDEDGFKFLMHGIGNLLGFDKEAPANRRTAIFDKNLIPSLVKYAEDPFGRLTLRDRKNKPTDIAVMVGDGEGPFQVLNAAHEVKRMVDWASARHKDKAQDPSALLQDPEVQADLIQNYETDFIVQLDAANNAYQNAGMLMGEVSLLQATGLLPPPGREGDPDYAKGADIYLEPARAVAQRVPELQAFPEKFLRKLFKRPIGTYLYAAEFNSRKEAFRAELEAKALDAPIAGFSEGEGLLTIPEAFAEGMRGDGAQVMQVKYDVEGEIKEAKTVLKRLKQTDNGKWKIEQKDGPKAKWKQMGASFDTPEEAIQETFLGDLFARMNQELIRDMNTRYPNVRKFLDFARITSDMARDRGMDHVKVPTADGILLQYDFKENPFFEAVEIDVAGKKAKIGVKSKVDPKLAGRGLAAFMAHQMDAFVLREVHRRMTARLGRQPKVFNPIHDSYGFHPSEAKLGQQTWAEVMFELGSPDYNLFRQVLEANGFSLEEFRDRGGPLDLIMARQGVAQPPAGSIPTALS